MYVEPDKIQLASESLASNFPKLNSMYNNGDPDPKYYLTPYNLEELSKLPKNTLGYKYATHMIERKFDPKFFTCTDIDNLAKFVVIRGRKTHDIWHIVTGFDTDSIGEVGLQAFYAAQTYTQFPTSIIIAGLFTILKNPSLQYSKTMLDTIFIGYQMGKEASLLLTEAWEDDRETDLEELQKRLNIKPLV